MKYNNTLKNTMRAVFTAAMVYGTACAHDLVSLGLDRKANFPVHDVITRKAEVKDTDKYWLIAENKDRIQIYKGLNTEDNLIATLYANGTVVPTKGNTIKSMKDADLEEVMDAFDEGKVDGVLDYLTGRDLKIATDKALQEYLKNQQTTQPVVTPKHQQPIKPVVPKKITPKKVVQPKAPGYKAKK